MDPQILQEIGLTPDQIQQLMQLGVLSEEGGIIGQEMEMANQLRNTRGPQGQFTGRSFTSANPLSFVGAGIDRIRGAYEQQKGIEKQRANAREKARLRQEFLAAMLKGRQGPTGATMTPAQVPQGGLAAPQRTPGQMFPMPAGGGGYGATVTPGMLQR